MLDGPNTSEVKSKPGNTNKNAKFLDLTRAKREDTIETSSFATSSDASDSEPSKRSGKGGSSRRRQLSARKGAKHKKDKKEDLKTKEEPVAAASSIALRFAAAIRAKLLLEMNGVPPALGS